MQPKVSCTHKELMECLEKFTEDSDKLAAGTTWLGIAQKSNEGELQVDKTKAKLKALHLFGYLEGFEDPNEIDQSRTKDDPKYRLTEKGYDALVERDMLMSWKGWLRYAFSRQPGTTIAMGISFIALVVSGLSLICASLSVWLKWQGPS